MTSARLQVIQAGPHVSIQDGGRPGNLRYGVPQSGPMDRLAHAAASVALGVAAESTAVEVSRGGLVLECVQGQVTVAVAGGDFTGSWQVRSLGRGDQLMVRAAGWGNWAYVGFLGDLVSQRWLGHSATHSMSGFGGGLITTGHHLDIENARVDTARVGEISLPLFARPDGRARVVLGPQDHHFDADAIELFLESSYTLTDAFDRMGVRLQGPELALRGALSIPSEPIMRGSVQVGGDGVPTVLLADHQTTGGYPKIATVISCDIDRFSQMRPGETVRFEAVSPAEAVGLVRAHSAAVAEYLDNTARPGRTLSQRLMQENLIGWHQQDD